MKTAMDINLLIQRDWIACPLTYAERQRLKLIRKQLRKAKAKRAR